MPAVCSRDLRSRILWEYVPEDWREIVANLLDNQDWRQRKPDLVLLDAFAGMGGMQKACLHFWLALAETYEKADDKVNENCLTRHCQ